MFINRLEKVRIKQSYKNKKKKIYVKKSFLLSGNYIIV